MTHEFGIVQSLVGDLLEHLQREAIKQVSEIHFRRGSAFSEESLQQAYRVLIPGTSLEGSKVVIETVNLHHECPCGHQQVITSDDLIGHMYICPQCGTMREIEEAHDLELVKVIAETEVYVSP
jgi:hydrogenase nickel incorporation protein HypA/HybF